MCFAPDCARERQEGLGKGRSGKAYGGRFLCFAKAKALFGLEGLDACAGAFAARVACVQAVG